MEHDPANISVEFAQRSRKDKIHRRAWYVIGSIVCVLGLIATYMTWFFMNTPFIWIVGICLVVALIGLGVTIAAYLEGRK